MTEFERGYEEFRSDLSSWAKARYQATGDRTALEVVTEFYLFMGARETEHAAELERYAERLRPRLVESAS